jgi:hypothetical protein
MCLCRSIGDAGQRIADHGFAFSEKVKGVESGVDEDWSTDTSWRSLPDSTMWISQPAMKQQAGFHSTSWLAGEYGLAMFY